MMKCGALIVAAGAMLAMPAAAQPPTGSLIGPAPGAVRSQPAGDQINARRVMRTFAACLMRNNSRIAGDILARPFGSDEQQEVIDRRVAGVHDCGGPGMSLGFNARALAGALAEAGLMTRFGSTGLLRLTRLTADQITIINLNPRNGFEELGLCVVRRAPDAVRAWAVSEPGSDAEANARRTVIPEIGQCVDQGQPLRADVVGLRAILSVALYRALHLTRP